MHFACAKLIIMRPEDTFTGPQNNSAPVPPTPTPIPNPSPERSAPLPNALDTAQAPATTSAEPFAPAGTTTPAAIPDSAPNPVQPANTAPTPAAGVTPPAQNKKKSPLPIIICAIALIVLIVLGVVFVPKLLSKQGSRGTDGAQDAQAGQGDDANGNYLLSVMQNDGSWKLMYSNGEYALENVTFYGPVGGFRRGVAKVKTEDGYAFMNMDGKMTKACSYISEAQAIPERNRWFACGTLYNENLGPITPEDVELIFGYDYDQSNRGDDIEFGYNKLYFLAINNAEDLGVVYDEDGNITASFPHGGSDMELRAAKIKNKDRANGDTYCAIEYRDGVRYGAIFNCATGKMIMDFSSDNTFVRSTGENLFTMQNSDFGSRGVYISSDQIFEDASVKVPMPYSRDYYKDYEQSYFMSYGTHEVVDGSSFDSYVRKQVSNGYSYSSNGKIGFRNNKDEDIIAAEYDEIIFPEYEARSYFDEHNIHVAVGKKDDFAYVLDLDSGDVLYPSPAKIPSDSLSDGIVADTNLILMLDDKNKSIYVYSPIGKTSAEFRDLNDIKDDRRSGWGFIAIKANGASSFDFYDLNLKKVYPR